MADRRPGRAAGRVRRAAATRATALPATCFFDGEHGLATVEVDLEGIALQRVPVRSCAACAVGLVRGERPRVGTVSMGGRALPWPAAPRWCGSYAWALKDLKHLHYDGTPLFAAPERPIGQRRQTVAERARGMRARVLPAGPEVLPEDEIDEVDEVEESFEAFEDGDSRGRARRAGRRSSRPRRSAPAPSPPWRARRRPRPRRRPSRRSDTEPE